MLTDRRSWLKQSSFALAGLGLMPVVSYADERKFFKSGNPIWLNSNENAYGPGHSRKKQFWDHTRIPIVTLMIIFPS